MPDPSTPTNDASLRAGWAREVRTRLSSLRLSPTREADILDELSEHLDDRWRELMTGGALPDEATQLTLAEFRDGNILARDVAPLRLARQPSSITPGRASTTLCQSPPAAARRSPASMPETSGAGGALWRMAYDYVGRPADMEAMPQADRTILDARRQQGWKNTDIAMRLLKTRVEEHGGTQLHRILFDIHRQGQWNGLMTRPIMWITFGPGIP